MSDALGDGAAAIGISLVRYSYAACTWAALAALAKRLHDMGASGGLCLLVFVPLVGIILAVLMLFLGGTNGNNRYGPATYLFKPRASYAELQGAA